MIGDNALKTVKKLEGAACKILVKYEVANDVRVPSLGEKIFVGYQEMADLARSRRKCAT